MCQRRKFSRVFFIVAMVLYLVIMFLMGFLVAGIIFD